MLAKLSGLIVAPAAVALVVAGLWGWGAAKGLVENTERPDLALWAVRSAAVAALAASQVLAMNSIIAAIYRRDRAGEAINVAAGAVCTAALLGAVILAIAGM